MNKLEIEKIIKYLGQPLKKCGNELIWQCPYCKDRGKDNLKYNTVKNVLYCFANSDHAKSILSEIYKENNKKHLNINDKPIKSTLPPAISTEKQKENFENYMYKCNETLLFDKNLLNFLYEKRGLTSTTVSMTKLGYDKQKMIWTIPTIQYNCNGFQVIGFEFRPSDLSKNGLYRTTGTPTGLAMINEYYNDIDTLNMLNIISHQIQENVETAKLNTIGHLEENLLLKMDPINIEKMIVIQII